MTADPTEAPEAPEANDPTDAVDPVLQTVPLDFQWPTVDPFLFCVHHDDAYPAGNEQMGPAAPLDGRDLGQDFAGLDGWRMYHGLTVPGFPQHPHRGFETVTFVRRGLIDHADSLGAKARFGRGDVQWVTAGAGIVHSEMFPLLDDEHDNPLELFQIWLNLPAADKMVDPYFTMLWDQDIGRYVAKDDEGRTTEVTVIAGALGPSGRESGDGKGVVAPPPPPDSYASRPEADVAIWHLRLEPGAHWTLPPAKGPDTVRVLYFFEGESLSVGGNELRGPTGAVVRAEVPVELLAGATEVDCLLLQGRPIGEPVAQYGPFVMNTRAEIEQAFRDYRATEFGGWPWPVDDPVHGTDPARFARHADGHTETAPV